MKQYIGKIFVATVVVGALTLSSCSSDYLDTEPTESIDASTALSTTENGYSALNGVAKSMSTQQYQYTQGFAGENAIIRLYEDMPSQNWNYNGYASGWAPLHNQTFHNRNNVIYDSYAWFYYYQIIGQANRILGAVDNMAGEQSDKNYIKAAAYTFRAYAFQKLALYYCYRWKDSNNGASQGLVLRLDASTGDLGYSTLAETYKQIYADCDSAVSLFGKSEHKRGGDEVWIPNVNVAHAVKARAALNRLDYSTALTEAKAAMDGYSLMSNDEYAAGFYEPTSEWIMGSYADASENLWYWSFGAQEGCNGYYASKTTNGTATIGHELIQRIPNNDARKQLFLTADKLEGIDLTKAGALDSTYGYIGLKSSNGSVAISDKAAYAAAEKVVSQHQLSGVPAPYQAGVYYLDAQFKFWVKALPGVGALPFIRASEMVLIQAEANYFLGNTADAQANLVELNAQSGRNPSYTCDKTGDALFEEIKDYRELELWGEGFAWSDYKRWNIPVVRHSFKEGGNAHASVAVTIKPEDGNKWTWVVPQNETDYNQALKGDATGSTPQ